MNLNELLNMLLITDGKRTKCHGNLRLKVLLKLTRNHAQRSWNDGLLGSPENLLTLLRNTHRDVVDHETDHEEPMDVDESQDYFPKIVQTSKTDSKSEKAISSTEHENKSVNSLHSDMFSLVPFKKTEPFKNKNIYGDKKQVLSKMDSKLQKTLEKLLKESNCFESESEFKNPQAHHHHKVKIRKLLNQCKFYLKTDFENQMIQLNAGQLLKIIKKLLREYECVPKINFSDTELNVLCYRSYYKFKKFSKKLKKYKNHQKYSS